MKRWVVLLVAASLAIAVYAVVGSAQGGMMGGGGGMGGAMAAPEEMGMEPPEGETQAMPRMMGPMMAGRAAIAVSGNHVFVLAGGLLLKYDQDLNLVKQAELPMGAMPTQWRGRGRGGGGGGGRGGMRQGGGW